MADPTSITDKVLWLRAKDLGAGGSSGTTWADQSGFGNDATSAGTAPTVAAASTANGGKSVRFPGTGAFALPDLGLNNAVASSNFSLALDAPKAIDGSTSTAWVSDAAPSVGAPQWLRVRPAAGTVATSYAITPRATFASQAPKDFTFQGSNDAQTWTTLDTQTGVIFTNQVEQTFSFSNSTAYTYYRLHVTLNDSGTTVSLAELKINGTANTATTAAREGEMWIVVKGDNIGGSWDFGTNSSLNHYPNGSIVYDDFGNGTRQSFTATLNTTTAFRLYRVAVSGTTWTAWLDGTQQKQVTSITKAWTSAPTIGRGLSTSTTYFGGNIAEVLVVAKSLSAGDVADFIGYFNSEHGLTVPGGSSSTAMSGTVAAVSGTSGAITSKQALSGTVAAVSGVSGTLYVPPAVDHPLSGTVEAVSGVAGDITVIPGSSTDHPLSGTVPAVAGTQGTVGLSLPLSGMVEAVSGTSGSATTADVVDPLTRRPQYQLIVVKPDGTRLGELNKAQALSPLEHDFAGESWDFAMPAHDPKLALCLAAVNEIQVWRGGQLLRWGPIIKRSGDDVQVRVSCASVRWYLDQKAQIGKLPKTDLLLNGDFEDGEAHWSFGYEADSIPALPPLHSIVPEGPEGSNALKISGADESQLVTASLQTLTIFVPNEATYLSGGEAQILDFAATLPPAPVGVIEGHTADADAGTGYALSLARANAVRSTIMTVRPAASFSTVGKGETEPTGDGWDADRRVVIKYEGLLPADGHRQYAYQRVNYMVPEAAKWPMRVVFIGSIKILDYVASSKDGWSVYIHRVLASDRSNVLDYGTAPLDADTPRGVWLEQECSIEVPADGVTYELEVRYYPPSGDALWDRGGLFPAERLGFVDVRQEHIIEHLVEHAQDPAMGNATLYIQNRPGYSGITRQRKYDFHEARSVGDAINDFQAIDKGLDVDVEVTPTGKYLASYYPRKGQDTGVTLALGGKVIRFDVQEDATQVGNVAVVNADGSGPGREQSYAMDPDALGGLRLRRTFSAEQETPAWELAQAADRQLARFRTPPLLWSITCDPKWTSWLLDRVKLGDTVHCVIDAGWAQIDGPVRIVGESLDPATDALTYDIDVEV